MKRIYYLDQHETKIGDIVEINGIHIPVTEESIKLNPDIFKVEEYK